MMAVADQPSLLCPCAASPSETSTFVSFAQKRDEYQQALSRVAKNSFRMLWRLRTASQS